MEALLRVSPWLGSVSGDGSGVASRLKEPKRKLGLGHAEAKESIAHLQDLQAQVWGVREGLGVNRDEMAQGGTGRGLGL